ncbi:hypothetical protein MNBD_GAMMA02-678, partial [hydrothermal vent metagenome]
LRFKAKYKLQFINQSIALKTTIAICLNPPQNTYSIYNTRSYTKILTILVIQNTSIILLLSILLTACNNSSESTDTKNNNNDIDSHNGTINVNLKLITSISLAPHLTELVYSAGGGGNLLGVSAYSNYPENALTKQIIGDAFHLNLELISELKPDVIFYWHNGTPLQTIEQLKSLGFNLENIDITYLADIPQAIQQIAGTLNTQPLAAVESFLPQLNQLKQQAHTKKTALVQISDQPIYTVSGNHWMSEAIEACGLNNVFDDLSSLSAAVTLEAVVLKMPAVIVRLEPLQAENQLTQWPIIPAVANQHIAVLEADHFTRPTLRTLSAIKSLCQQVNNF